MAQIRDFNADHVNRVSLAIHKKNLDNNLVSLCKSEEKLKELKRKISCGENLNEEDRKLIKSLTPSFLKFPENNESNLIDDKIKYIEEEKKRTQRSIQDYYLTTKRLLKNQRARERYKIKKNKQKTN